MCTLRVFTSEIRDFRITAFAFVISRKYINICKQQFLPVCLGFTLYIHNFSTPHEYIFRTILVASRPYLMYEGFNGELPASRMHACGKGSDRKANAQRVRLAEMRSLFRCAAATDFNLVPSHDQRTPIVPHFGRNICRFPNTPASASSTTRRYLRRSFGRKRERERNKM